MNVKKCVHEFKILNIQCMFVSTYVCLLRYKPFTEKNINSYNILNVINEMQYFLEVIFMKSQTVVAAKHAYFKDPVQLFSNRFHFLLKTKLSP